jgi:DNA-binding winged helix-turn-helix (wHTH) protein/TolB-like protein
MKSSSSLERFRFDHFEVDVPAAELRRNGRKVPIQDKPLHLLAFLSQHSGQVVSRIEIQHYLWPQDTTVSFEDGLNTAVRKLREALHDNCEKPRYIETVRRRGYRFLADVQTLPDEADTAEPQPAPAIEPPQLPTTEPHQSAAVSEPLLAVAEAIPPVPSPALLGQPAGPSLLLSTAGLIMAIAACVAAGIWLVHHNRVVAAAGRPYAVAVLPIANLTGNPKLNYLTDGVTEEIIARLGDVDPESVRVTGRMSAMSFRNTRSTAREIGSRLGVGYLLEGTFQGDEKNLRLFVQMVRTSDQSQLWTRTYSGSAAQLPEFEREIADLGARSLPGARAPGDAAQPTPVSAEVHDLYLQGLYAVAQRSQAGFQTALLTLRGAVQKEPRYGEAYAELAVSCNLMGQYDWMAQEEARSQGRAAAMQALALDPTLAEARAALGFSYWFYDWDSERALDELRSAVARQPNNVDAHHWLAMVLLTSDQLDQAEEQMREALTLDPASPILQTNLGWVHYTQGRFPLAVRELTDVLKQSPKFIPAHFKLLSASYMMGDQDRAWEEVQTIARLAYPAETFERMNQAHAKGGLAAALKLLVATPAGAFYANDVDQARELMFAGDSVGALRKLQDGARSHDGWMVFVPIDPAFGPLRKEPVFTRIAEDVQKISTQISNTQLSALQ